MMDKKEKLDVDGVLVLNKDSGITSNSACNRVKYLLNAKKAGHLGTLDPLGMGVLPVTLGKATKLFDEYLKKKKIYETIFEFGYETDTLDTEGKITNRNDIVVNIDNLKKVVNKFIGEQDQIPPQYSAKKINGKKAYELAREGIVAELKPKTIIIYNLEVLEEIKRNVFKLKVECSSGTYIRSLCRDIAKELSTYGVMLQIIRTKCGDFDISNSYTMEDIINGNYKIISLENLKERR